MGRLSKVKPVEVKVRLEDYIHLILGEPKTGKSTLFRDLVNKHYNGDMSKGLLLGFEPGYNALDGLHAEPMESWEDWEEILEELIEDRKNISYRFIAIDTIDEFVAMAIDRTLRDSKKKDGKIVKTLNEAFGGFMRGRDYCIDLINDSLNKLKKGQYGIFLIGHTKLKKKNTGVILGDGQEYMQLCSNLATEFETVFTKKADMMTYLVVEKMVDSTIEDIKKRTSKSKVNMVFRSDGTTNSGGRFTELPESLTYSVDNYLLAFEQGVKSSILKPKTDEEIKETAKRQEQESNEKAEKAKEKKTIKEMVDLIKKGYSSLGDGAKIKMGELVDKAEVSSLDELTEDHRSIVEQMLELVA